MNFAAPSACKIQVSRTFNFFLFIFSLFFASLQAQSPEKMSYQAVIRNATDDLVASSTIGMRISILQGSVGGTAVYVETHTPSTNASGLVTIEIGTGSVVSGNFAAIDWSNGPYFLKTETDPDGGTNYTITGTSQFLSVPYALHANTADSLSGVDLSVFAKIDMQNQNITNLADPVNDKDAATKTYVDELKYAIYEELLDAGLNGVVKDIDGNFYKTIKIGNEGTPIDKVTDGTEWINLTSGAYCWYDNDSASYENLYGKLYIWYTVNTGKLCPTGWHVPADTEWTVLNDYLTNNGYGYEGSGSDIGKSMAATSGWTTSPTAGTVGNDQASNNSSAFTALPGGNRFNDGNFYDIGSYGLWWSTTVNDASTAWSRYIYNTNSNLLRDPIYKVFGFSIRCLRD
jgi:uncharacterized protein (TIGR02145 family)